MRLPAYIALALLAGCGSGQTVPTGSENAQLDDAANMLDQADKKLANVDQTQLQPEKSDSNSP